MPKKSAIGEVASAATKAEFAETLSSFTTLTADEVAALFPQKADRDELLALLQIVAAASDENAKRAALISQIDKVAGAVLRIVGHVAKGI